MSAAVQNVQAPNRSILMRLMAFLRRLVRIVWLVIASPVRLFLSIRRSMTGASATLLVIGIVTLNIIWGYPWIGMFSACFSLLIVGWIVNFVMRPNFGFSFTLPPSAPAGQAVSLLLHGKNMGRLPAMDLSVGICLPGGRRSILRNSRDIHSDYRVLLPAHSLALVEPGQRVDLPAMIAFDRRGIHPLPDLFVASSFPFHLFRSLRRQPSETQLAITPRPLTGEEDSVARGMLDAFGGWSHKLLSGDALDYTGSREYQTGMPVRRWDFTSWARLGKPIVREFQSPSIQLVTMIVDTSFDEQTMGDADLNDELLERVLSLAATGITTLNQQLVRVRLCLTCEESQDQTSASAMLNPSDCQSMLIRLAAADTVSAELADSRMSHMLEQVGRSPGMILTSRGAITFPNGIPSSVSVLRVDSAHHENAAAKSNFESPTQASHDHEDSLVARY